MPPRAACRLPLLAAAAAAALGARQCTAAAAAFASSSRRPPAPSSPPPRRRGPGPAGGAQKYFLVHKPFQVMTQFSPAEGKLTLKDVCGSRVPGDVYPVGRLDFDSEGLLLLTNDPAVNYKLLDPVRGHEREYWAQVEGAVTDEALRQLAAGGLELNLGKGKTHRTLPCEAARLQAPSPEPGEDEEDQPLPPGLGRRDPPIRYRKSIPTSWLQLRLIEGKNRQVRRMTAAVGFPTLRLVRWSIEDLTLEGLPPGEVREMGKGEVYEKLKL